MLSVNPVHIHLLPTDALVLYRPSPLQKVAPLVEVSFGHSAESSINGQGIPRYDWKGYLSEPDRKGVFIDVYG